MLLRNDEVYAFEMKSSCAAPIHGHFLCVSEVYYSRN